MSDEGPSFSRRGNYLTQERYLELERKIAAQDARLNERMDQLDQRLTRLAGDVWAAARAQAGALIDVLKDRAGQ